MIRLKTNGANVFASLFLINAFVRPWQEHNRIVVKGKHSDAECGRILIVVTISFHKLDLGKQTDGIPPVDEQFEKKVKRKRLLNFVLKQGIYVKLWNAFSIKIKNGSEIFGSVNSTRACCHLYTDAKDEDFRLAPLLRSRLGVSPLYTDVDILSCVFSRVW